MYMPFDILRHVNPRAAGRIAFGGGGGGGGTPSALGSVVNSVASGTVAPTPRVITSDFPELAGQVFNTEEDKAAAEKSVTDQRAAGTTSKEIGEFVSSIGTDAGAAQQNYSNKLNVAKAELERLQAAAANDPENESYAALVKQKQDDVSKYQSALNTAQGFLASQQNLGQQRMVSEAMNNPSALVEQAKVGEIATDGTEIASGAGQLTGDATTADLTTAAPAATATAPAATPAATIEAAKVSGAAQEALGGVQAAQGTVSDQAQVTAQQGDQLQQLDLDAAQLAQAQTVKAPAERVLQEGELIQGSSVDMNKVNEAVQFEAAQAVPSKQATVQGQLEELTANFDVSNPPAWAAGALRAATATMAARGLGASSMAGQAVVQATLEAAMPIAMQDAQTVAQFEAQNLSNRQQTALFAAQQRATFLGMEFTQDFQARVANAARIGEIANINFTAEQQVALENARMAQSVDLANLSNANAKVLADAAALTQLDLTNLNNRQQAAVANAKSFLDMDMANLSANQQATMFKAQALQQALLSDQAAENAAKQFNASSENQVTQFFANLATQTSQFNASQQNALNQFNAGQTNAMEQFNANVKNQRDQFNAQNALVVAQANAQWRQSVATTEFAAQHEANLEAAKTANTLTENALDQIWQRERDLMSFAWKSSESSMDRTLSVLLADKDLQGVREQLDAEEQAAKGAFVTKLLFDW